MVGIDHYDSDEFDDLHGAVDDALKVAGALERTADGSVNFATPRLLTATDPGSAVTERDLKDAVQELFADDSEIVLFYFSGHGYIEDAGGGYLCASDCRDGDDGLPLTDVVKIASASRARNKVIILDSCFSGDAGAAPLDASVSQVPNGMTVLTASTAEQFSMETGGGGVFTTLLVDALNGAAADVLGSVTPGSVYAHIDQSLGPWAQRPVFKTNIKRFIKLRTAEALLELRHLRQLPTLFGSATEILQLDPSYEPERSGAEEASVPPPNPTNTAKFEVLQRLESAGLVRPIGASKPHMWHAAMQSKGCELTAQGQHYWRLATKQLL